MPCDNIFSSLRRQPHWFTDRQHAVPALLGLVCVPTTPSISEKFRRASTSINFEVGASSAIDSIENAVATSIGLMDEPTEAAIKRVAGASTCSQLLRYYPPKDAPSIRKAPAPTFSYEDPADESDDGDESMSVANSPTDSLDVSTAYELHTGESGRCLSVLAC